FAHPVFTQYHTNAPRWVKQLVAEAIARLLPMPLLQHKGPSTITSSVMRQSQRTIVHLLHYIPERRGLDFDVIEDVIPLYNVQIAIRADRSISQIYLAPQMQTLPHIVRDGYYHVTIPVIDGHAMIVCDDA
ncbi:MAG: beta-galactosidase, partial [Chloroflexia bacterium]|nr:beta-galactosidase [Chloroflexia bacterium]